jgi:hypothetical protein
VNLLRGHGRTLVPNKRVYRSRDEKEHLVESLPDDQPENNEADRQHKETRLVVQRPVQERTVKRGEDFSDPEQAEDDPGRKNQIPDKAGTRA